MATDRCALTVYFEDPFWVGLFERWEGESYRVSKLTFGPEPRDAEVWERVLREFGLDPARPVVSYVSRMDADRALAARQLIEIAPRLDKAVPGVQLLIAGGGNVFDELKDRAEAVNEKMGRRCIAMTGPRTDINEIAAAGTPCIIVPSPNVTNNHQEKNARILEERGAAVVLREDECDGDRLYAAAKALLHDDARRAAMRSALRQIAVVDSAERIYRILLELAKR